MNLSNLTQVNNCKFTIKKGGLRATFQTADEPHYFGGVLSFERPQVAIAIFFPFTLPALSAT
ncbi:hypothetical protein, partial [Yersinia enterocolitica]